MSQVKKKSRLEFSKSLNRISDLKKYGFGFRITRDIPGYKETDPKEILKIR